MKVLDAKTLARFVVLAGERLQGEWVIIGGCVLPLLGVEHRVTVDIDIAGPDDTDMRQMLALMEIAEELDLPVETINQSGSHFLRLIEDWRERLLEIHRGVEATLYVPDATLFLLLKLRRLTEADLLDCREMLSLSRRHQMAIDKERVRVAAHAALESAPVQGRRARIKSLLRALDRDV